jgi:uncharacterized membrane protein
VLDTLRKLIARHLSAMQAVFWVAAGQIPVLLVWAGAADRPSFGWRYLAAAAGSIGLNVVANVAFVRALARSPISVMVPLLSLIPVMTTAFAVPLLGERPRPVQAVGILLVVAGALLLGGAMAGGGSLAAWWRALVGEPGTPLMGVVAVCWALALPLDKVAVGEAGAAVHGVVLASGVALAALVALLARGGVRQLAVPRAALPTLAGAVAVAIVALVLQLLAIAVIWVGAVESVKRVVGNVAALLAGAALWGERIGWRKALALVAMAAGVALILLPA